MTQPARPWWRRLRLSIRGLMILVLVIGAPLGWYISRVAVQRAAVRAIQESGGSVRYDFDATAMGLPARPPAPEWLVKILGVDFFAYAVFVKVGPGAPEAIFSEVGRLSRLEHLDAPTNISNAGLGMLANLTELQTLDLQGDSRLTDAGLAHLAGMKRLKHLWISGEPKIKGQGLAYLAGLGELDDLLIGTETSDGLEHLARLKKLRVLFIELGSVDDAALTQLSRLTHLEQLAFGGERGKDVRMGDLRTLRRLKILQVYGAWFSDDGLVPIADMDHLIQFFVSDQTNVTPEGLANLQRKLPKLDIGVNGSGKVPQARTDSLRNAVLPMAFGKR